MERITRNIEVKTPLTAELKDKLLKDISGAYKIISEKNAEIDAHKDAVSTLKDEIGAESAKVASIIAVYDKGYESKMVECEAIYKDGEATFTDVHTGEIVDQRPMTEAEQLQLSGNRIDAEDIIRNDNEET